MSYKSLRTCMNVMLVAVLLLFIQPVWSQNSWPELDAALDSRKKLLGDDLVMMVWKKDDTLIYKKELGSFNSKTVAPIASCSKWLTAALVMQFVDEGKLSLDDKISRWIPDFARYGKNYVTIRHCLAHLTGVEDEGKLLKKLFQRRKFDSLDEEANAFARKEIRANAGTDFWYGNIGLNLAGRVLEVISKKKFDALIKQKLFNPLAMRKTSFTPQNGGAVNPSGGARSTADDYMRFLVMLMNDGKYGDKVILSPEAVSQLKEIQTKTDLIKYAPESANGLNYALGSWVIDEKDGKAKTLACPGLFGTWPMINFEKGYAYLVFVKELLGEERAAAHLELKEIVERGL